MNRLTRIILWICMFGTLSGLSAGIGVECPSEDISWLLKRFSNEPSFAQNWSTKNDFYHVVSVTEQVQKVRNAHGPTHAIQSIVDKALHAARITKPIIVLQRCLNGNSCVFTVQAGPTAIQYLIVDTGGGLTPNQIIGSIYHEVGHIAHEDGLLDINWPISQNKVNIALRTITALLLPKTVISGAFQILVGQYIEKSMERRAEKRADEFACELLIKTGQINAALDLAAYLTLSDAPTKESFMESIMGSFFSTHPNGKDRAQNILRIAKEYALGRDAVQRSYSRLLYESSSPLQKNQMLGMLYLKPYATGRFNK